MCRRYHPAAGTLCVALHRPRPSVPCHWTHDRSLAPAWGSSPNQYPTVRLLHSPNTACWRGESGGEHLSEEAESDGQTEEDKKWSGLRAAPFSPLHVTSNPGRNTKTIRNHVFFLHEELTLITVLHVCSPDVFKNKVKMGLEVGVAVCENDVSCMTEEQTVCLNKPCQCNPGLNSSKQSSPHAIHACYWQS